MRQIISDFGTDHVWQMDGFFGNGTGWSDVKPRDCEENEKLAEGYALERKAGAKLVPCTWSEGENNTYLKGCANANANPNDKDCRPLFATLDKAQAACASAEWPDCSGVTKQLESYQLRAGFTFNKVPASAHEVSYAITVQYNTHYTHSTPY
jgi:hypothetical protein